MDALDLRVRLAGEESKDIGGDHAFLLCCAHRSNWSRATQNAIRVAGLNSAYATSIIEGACPPPHACRELFESCVCADTAQFGSADHALWEEDFH